MKLALWGTILVALILVEAQPASAQIPGTDSADFRAAHWGQTQEEVQRLEGKTPIRKDDSLVVFQDSFQGMPAEVAYFFMEEKLVMGFTRLQLDHTDLDDYFADYEQVKAFLAQRMGSPDVENWQMNLPDLEENRSMWAEALGFGLIKVEAGWLFDKTAIALRLSGAELAGHLTIIHISLMDMNNSRIAFKDYFAQRIGVPNQYFQN
jgi:hypothetical protein